MRNRAKVACGVLAALAVWAGGCVPSQTQRADEIARFRQHLDQEALRLKIDPARPLGLAQCEELTLSGSLDLRVRRLALQVQDDQVGLALSGGLPKATFSYFANYRSNKPLIQFEGLTTQMEDQNLRGLSVQAVAPVLDFGLTYYSYRIAVDQRTQQRLVIERAEQLLRRDVRIAYARAAGAVRQERLASLACQAASQVLRVARSLERAQMTVRADTALIEAALAQAALDLSQARQQVEATHLVLSQLMSLPPGMGFTIVDELPPLPPPPTAELVAAYEDRALRVRPELSVQDRQRDISVSAVRKEIAAFFPHLDATGSFNWSSASLVVNPAYFLGGFQVTQSLLDAGATLWRYDLAKKNVGIERERSLLISLGILYDVELAALKVKLAHETIQASQTLEKARREGLERIISLYKEGLEDEAGAARSLADLTIQSTVLDQAQTNYLAAWYELEAAALPAVSAIPAPAPPPASQPATQPGTQPATQPAGPPATLPAGQGTLQAATQPAQPSSRPALPTSRPAGMSDSIRDLIPATMKGMNP